jgi:glycosyltransferase involved in cell wall biosynthesis
MNLSKPESVAVIVAVRDGAKFLGAAIDSIVAQIVESAVEIVVVDDGSRDESAMIAASSRGVRCVRQLPLGVAAALNSGLEATAAPLLAFLDADDLMPPGSLAARRAVLDRDRDCDIAIGRMAQFLDADMPAAARQRLRADPRPVLAHSAGSCLIRRTAFDTVGRFDPAVGAATFLDWVLRARHAGIRFQEVDAVVLERRVHGANLSLNRTVIQASYLRILRRHFARQRAKG